MPRAPTTGKAAHAAAAPHKGRNALDAAVLGYMNVAALRQHIRPDERIHGIFTEAGDAANIVPDRPGRSGTSARPRCAGSTPLKQRVLDCLEAGTKAAGCTMTYEWKDPAYADLVDLEPFDDLYVENVARLGREVLDHRASPGVVGSTDMGNVSYLVPVDPPDDPGVAAHTSPSTPRTSSATPGAPRATPRSSTGPRRWP